MPGDLSLHVVHASITYLDGVCVANFVKRVSCWKGLPQNCQELFSYIGFYILAEGGVKPGDLSVFSSVSGGFIPGIGVIDLNFSLRVSTRGDISWCNLRNLF